MTMQDPIADALTRIRNAQAVGHKSVSMPASKLLTAILTVLQTEGYIRDFTEEAVEGSDVKKMIVVRLKYHEGRPVIDTISRVSTPGRKQYVGARELPKEKEGLGIVIISTSQGVMTTHQAEKLGLGGELLVAIY